MALKIPATLEARRGERPFFQHASLAAPMPHYVAWLDIMGASAAMRRSLPMSTNFVMKLHIACQTASKRPGYDRLELFPVIDGVYIASPTLRVMRYFLKDVMSQLALTFVFEEEQKFRFMVRGALAYGSISKGSALQNINVNLDATYTKHIVLGSPLSQAHDDERNAPPFGIFTSESARMFSPEGQQPLQGVHLKWWSVGNDPKDNELLQHLKIAIHQWYAWAEKHPESLMYDPSRMKAHRALFDEYFADD